MIYVMELQNKDILLVILEKRIANGIIVHNKN